MIRVSALVSGDVSPFTAAAARLGGSVEVEWTASPEEFERAVSQRRPDVIVGDAAHSALAEGESPGAWLERFASLPSVVLVEDDDRGLEVLRAGAVDYLLRDSLDAPTLHRSLRRAVARNDVKRQILDHNAWFRGLIGRVADRITVVDAAGTILYESPAVASILGYPPERLEGLNLFETLHPTDVPVVRQAVRDLVEGSADFRAVRARARRADGKWRVLELSGTNALDDPAVGGIVVNSRDVTETIELEEQLRQAQKMEAVGRLASGVAHDFNNLLTSIGGFASLAATSLPEEHPARNDIDEVQRAATRASELTRQLLAFSRKEPTTPSRLDLNGTLKELERMIGRIIGEDILVRFEPSPEPVPVVADPGQVEQVVMNLVVNARDAMPKGGELRIGVERVRIDDQLSASHGDVPPGTYSVISVSDTGGGMPSDVRRRVFEPFFSTKPAGEGTGLGLSMVWGIMARHGGTVHLYSEPGEGTVFRLYFPSDTDAPELSPPGPREGSPGAGGTERILLVEDDPQVRGYAARVLEEKGYEVLEAESMATALDRLRDGAGHVDLLITDVIMPGGSGTDLTRVLREREPTLPVLLVSGYAEKRVADRGLLGVDAPFIEKPFTPETLLAKVRGLLGARQV